MEYPWNTMEINGIQWNTKEINGILWNTMRHQWNPMGYYYLSINISTSEDPWIWRRSDLRLWRDLRPSPRIMDHQV